MLFKPLWLLKYPVTERQSAGLVGRCQGHGDVRLVRFPVYFSHHVSPFVTGIFRALEIAGVEMLVYFARRHKLSYLIHQVFRARPPDLEVSSLPVAVL